jgi:23S rRNA pseudouridine2605 synthase
MTKKIKKSDKLQPELEAAPEAAIENPIEADTAAENNVDAQIDSAEEVAEPGPGLEAASGDEDSDSDDSGSEDGETETGAKPRPPAKLERLQKILAQAGVASRRKAEEMIEQGRVQLNGKVVAELGTKADAGRDHIRVDGKLLQGAERLRYFILNKPKGFVTTVKDPEGRPTVMQFFDKMKERLYPVGRLDYMSEGLLLVTNDGELANRLTKAASGVEKTYLVKVAGQPSESELDILRGGVAIERGKPGSSKVRTSPARIRQVRQGDNPWYEVVLIEGRNRELRKMFEEIGHFVEKIRRIGYGPLVLDQEPGNLRELQPDELVALRLAAEGKLRTPKSKELRRRNAMDAAGLPTVAPRPSPRPRPSKPFVDRPAAKDSGEFRPRKAFGPGATGPDKPFRSARPAREEFRPAAGRTRGPARDNDRPSRPSTSGAGRYGSARPAPDRPSARPAWQKPSSPTDARPTRPPARFSEGTTGESRPASYGAKPAAGRSFAAKPAWKKPGSGPGDKPAFNKARPAFKRPATPPHDEDFGPVRPPNLHIEEIPQSERSAPSRSSAPRSSAPRSSSSHPFRSEGGLPRAFTTSSGKPRAGGARPSSKRGGPPDRSSSVGWKPGIRTYGSAPDARPASSSRPPAAGARSIDPRTGSGYRPAPGGTRTGSGYRPSPAGNRSFDGPRSGSGSRSVRPYTPRAEGASGSSLPHTKKFQGASASRGEGAGYERKPATGWKPKTRYGGAGKPASGSKPGGFSKSGYKGKPSGSGPKHTGSKPGGKPGGKKRG